jgi:hypothetical protein
MTRRPAAATAETGFRWGLAPTLAEAKFVEGAGIAEPDFAEAPDIALDIALRAVAAETARSARRQAAVAAVRRKCCRIEPHPAQPRGYRRSRPRVRRFESCWIVCAGSLLRAAAAFCAGSG